MCSIKGTKKFSQLAICKLNYLKLNMCKLCMCNFSESRGNDENSSLLYSEGSICRRVEKVRAHLLSPDFASLQEKSACFLSLHFLPIFYISRKYGWIIIIQQIKIIIASFTVWIEIRISNRQYPFKYFIVHVQLLNFCSIFLNTKR